VKAEDLRTLDAEELTSRLKGARRELYELRFKHAVGQLDDHRQIRSVRKDIARILTVVHTRRLEGTLEDAVDLTGMDAVSLPEPAEATAGGEAAGEQPEGAAEQPAAEAVEPETGEETPENVETSASGEAEAPASRRTRRRPAAEEGE
jgi:large subunit ribosomal protein L29